MSFQWYNGLSGQTRLTNGRSSHVLYGWQVFSPPHAVVACALEQVHCSVSLVKVASALFTVQLVSGTYWTPRTQQNDLSAIANRSYTTHPLSQSSWCGTTTLWWCAKARSPTTHSVPTLLPWSPRCQGHSSLQWHPNQVSYLPKYSPSAISNAHLWPSKPASDGWP